MKSKRKAKKKATPRGENVEQKKRKHPISKAAINGSSRPKGKHPRNHPFPEADLSPTRP